MLRRLPLLLAALAASDHLAEGALSVEKLIIYSRHGIRVPFPPDARPVTIFTADDAPGPARDWFTNFSDWGAAGVAHLTSHGEAVVQPARPTVAIAHNFF